MGSFHGFGEKVILPLYLQVEPQLLGFHLIFAFLSKKLFFCKRPYVDHGAQSQIGQPNLDCPIGPYWAGPYPGPTLVVITIILRFRQRARFRFRVFAKTPVFGLREGSEKMRCAELVCLEKVSRKTVDREPRSGEKRSKTLSGGVVRVKGFHGYDAYFPKLVPRSTRTL